MRELLMGNEAIALGAMAAGVSVVTGYPGTPSTEVLETIAKRNPGHIYVEWSVNEKSAMEVGAGAAYSGARVMVTMKQVGLNVASDPLMSLNYIGVKGGMVILVCDDPGPISSQTEQDTRHFGRFAKVPVFDPATVSESYEMIQDAFDYSEKYGTPVFFRSTTRISHSCASIDVKDIPVPAKPEGFIKDSSRFVIFPRLSYRRKLELEAREPVMSKDFSTYPHNQLTGSGSVGIACGGIAYAYIKEELDRNNDKCKLFKVTTPFPFPEELALEFLDGLDTVLVFEELDPVIEDALIHICGKHGKKIVILGKRNGFVPCAGELSSELAAIALDKLFDRTSKKREPDFADMPEMPMRPPVLCAGCPHRASFYAVKKAMTGREAVFCGDIGCYTLGNAAPLDMVDTCLCMGAGITIAQGIMHASLCGSDTQAKAPVCFSFVGDSTFFHTGIPGVINAVYNKSDIVLVVLDNSTTAMTGHQTHPGIGKTVMGDIAPAISIDKILEAIGVSSLRVINPLDFDASVDAVKAAAEETGVRAIIFRSPCVALLKGKSEEEQKLAPFGHIGTPMTVDTKKCIGCKRCINELGCPSLYIQDKKAAINPSLCNGCGLCAQICPVAAIK